MTPSNPSSPVLNQFVVATDFIKVVSSGVHAVHSALSQMHTMPDHRVYTVQRGETIVEGDVNCYTRHKVYRTPTVLREYLLAFRVSSVTSYLLLLFDTLFSLRLDTCSFGWISRRVRYRRRYRLISLLPFRIHSSTFACHWHFNRDFSSQIPYWGELGESIESFHYRNPPYRLSNDA